MLFALSIAETRGSFLYMRKVIVCLIALACLLSFWGYAADTMNTQDTSRQTMKSVSVKAAKMNARGKVLEVSDKAIKIERKIKGNVETMEFFLETPVQDISVNDSVKIVYHVKEGVFVVARIAKLTATKHPGKNGKKQTTEIRQAPAVK